MPTHLYYYQGQTPSGKSTKRKYTGGKQCFYSIKLYTTTQKSPIAIYSSSISSNRDYSQSKESSNSITQFFTHIAIGLASVSIKPLK